MSTKATDVAAPGSDLTEDQHKVLQFVYDTWQTTGLKWPLSQYVDRMLHKREKLDLAAILPMIHDRYFRYRPTPDQGEMILTLEGVAACTGSEGDIAVFLRALRWCVDREEAFTPPSPTEPQDLRLTKEDARSDWTAAGADVSDLTLDKAYALLMAEMIPWGAGMGADGWYVNITRRVRAFARVATLPDYLAVIQAERAALASAPPPPAVPSVRRRLRSRHLTSVLPAGALDGLGTPTVSTGSDDSSEPEPVFGASELHDLVAAACLPRFELGHFREGVLAAILAYRDLVKQRSGLADENDNTLMGKAFGGKPVPALVVADLTTEDGKNVQRGMAHLSEGLLAFVRNPLTHNASEIESVTAMRMIALVDMLVRAVDEAPAPS
jgi:uncharacterized protein (TIGR02391 family)